MSSLHARGREMLDRIAWSSIITETVTVYVRSSREMEPTELSGVTAFRRVLDEATAAVFGGSLPRSSIVWHLRTSTMPAGTSIGPGSWIEDSEGVEWFVPPDMANAVRVEQWADRIRVATIRGM